MNRFSRQIAWYIVQTVVPYFVFSWLLLSVILFVQQASRYSDIFFNTHLPSSLIWQLTFALIPNVIAFTCPMAILVGVIIGFSRMQGDSELTAIRSAGIGNVQITIPVILIGLLLSAVAFAVNFKGVPLAAQIVRKIATQTAIYKLESPIEPGVFNTEVQGFTIYVKDGDIENGTWKNIFIYNEDKNANQARLITSKNGRIDSRNENSELVLEKASVTTFSSIKPYKNLFSEKFENLRFVIQTKRHELIEKLSQTDATPEEMGLTELAAYAQSKIGKERIEAEIVWHRRIILSITPLIFAVLGAALVLRFNRSGKGFGIFLALVSLIIYYLITLFGEQLARTGIISVFSGSLLPVFLSGVAVLWFFLSQRLFLNNAANNFLRRINLKLPFKFGKIPYRNISVNLSAGILDFDIVSNLTKYFLLTFGFLAAIYMIFTAFELWKFAGVIDNGTALLAEYLFFLIPFIYIQISPSALMIAMLATYIIKSRQNEVVTWIASGYSIYRLLFPCFTLMMIIGFVNWEIQERVLPASNQRQDALRAQLRNKGILTAQNGRYWVASENRIYSFEMPENALPETEQRQQVRNLTIYQFASDDAKLQSLIKTDDAWWEKGKIKFAGSVEKTVWTNGVPHTEMPSSDEREIAENYNPFKETMQKPSHLNTRELAELIKTADSETEQRAFAIALEKKYTTPFLPLIITFFTASFALSMSRRGKVATVGYAVGIWLLFMGLTNFFEQFGSSGLIAPKIALWSPLLLFAVIGGFLMSKVQT